ncbi:hypothetical protein TL16_g08881 [Triparma laevis f. inornata]|uniref:CRAL-TRIO domain-containing protein n=1 Tax=Triparma laevis f. inornata TaxID=1714386 RepID=A0A9W7ELD3_9STRA|nr:hypothetical protein TL16_g08881 [Triparma laevis f. inornata]
MPENVSQFTVVADTSGILYHRAITKPKFFTGMAQLFVKAFPDRLGIFLGKSSSIVQVILKIIKPILPDSVSTKMIFPGDFEGNLKGILRDENDLPDWAGGGKLHPEEVRKNFEVMMKEIKVAMGGNNYGNRRKKWRWIYNL